MLVRREKWWEINKRQLKTSERQRGTLNDHTFQVQWSLVFPTRFSRYRQGHADKRQHRSRHKNCFFFLDLINVERFVYVPRNIFHLCHARSKLCWHFWCQTVGNWILLWQQAFTRHCEYLSRRLPTFLFITRRWLKHIEKTCLTTFPGAISIPLLEFPRRQLSQKLKSSKNFQHAKKFHKCFLSPFLLCFFFETSPRDVH